MHTEIGQDIREYQETIFFGLNMRQFICSVLGIIVAVALWMALSPRIGAELASWLCCIGVVPFAAVGFVKINGQRFERFALAWFKFTFLEPKVLKFRTGDLLVNLLWEEVNVVGKEENADEVTGSDCEA